MVWSCYVPLIDMQEVGPNVFVCLIPRKGVFYALLTGEEFGHAVTLVTSLNRMEELRCFYLSEIYSLKWIPASLRRFE
jgi:hypothetical protein